MQRKQAHTTNQTGKKQGKVCGKSLRQRLQNHEPTNKKLGSVKNHLSFCHLKKMKECNRQLPKNTSAILRIFLNNLHFHVNYVYICEIFSNYNNYAT